MAFAYGSFEASNAPIETHPSVSKEFALQLRSTLLLSLIASLQNSLPLTAGPSIPAKTKAKGIDYARQDRVTCLDLGPGEATLLVSGTRDYEVELRWDESNWDGWCECEAFQKWGPCKHVFASALVVAAETEVVAAKPKGDTRHARNPWRAKVGNFVASVNYMAADREESGPTIDQLKLVLDGSGMREDGVGLLLLRRRKKVNGSWGKLKTMNMVGPGSEAGLDAIDREIAQMLQGVGSQALVDRWSSNKNGLTLPIALARAVLPLAARNGRLYLPAGSAQPQTAFLRVQQDPDGIFEASDSELGHQTRVIALGFDGGGAWRSELRVVELTPDRGGPGLTLERHMVRGEESLGQDEVRCVLGEAGLLVHGRDLGLVDDCGPPFIDALIHPDTRPIAPLKEAREFSLAMAACLGNQLHSAPELEWEERQPTPVLEVQRSVHGRLLWSVVATYGTTRLPIDQLLPRAVALPGGTIVERDRVVESGFLTHFLDLLLAAGTRSKAFKPGSAEGFLAPEHLAPLSRVLIEEDWEVYVEDLRIAAPGRTSVSVTSGVDWFDLEGGVDFDGQIVPVPALLEAARSGGGLVPLANGGVGLLPERWLARWEALELGTVNGDSLRFGSNQGLLLDVLLSERADELELTADKAFRNLQKRIAGFSSVKPLRESKSFHGTLRPYQRDGLGWLSALRKLGLGGCLADEMGLGKTVQVLAHTQKIKAATRVGQRKPTLVVAPRSLAFQWRAEAERFTPGLKVVDHRGSERARNEPDFKGVDLLLTTYGTLRRDAELLASISFDTVVLDEATAIKNAQSQTAKAARLLHSDYRLALSGTPIENHLGELWSLFEFLNPGMLGRSGRFRELLKRSAQDEDYRDAGFLLDVQRSVAPFLLRRRKEDVLEDLPDKTVETLFVELSKRERREYDRIRDHFRSALLQPNKADGSERAESEGLDLAGMRFQVLEALLRLRQASCHLGLLDPNLKGAGSAKLDALFEQLQPILETDARKALIFSQFTSHLDIVRQEVEARGIPYQILTGRTTKRAQAVQRFQEESEVKLFLISIKAGGHGLNLTAADTVFLLDPWWNPAVEAQAIDRSHRSGQTRPVFAYRIIARDTVEEKVLALQERKQSLADAVLGNERSLLASLTREELEGLF